MEVILTARSADFSVRAVAPYDVAVERARDLLALGWEVELTDSAGNSVVWAPRPSDPWQDLHHELVP